MRLMSSVVLATALLAAGAVQAKTVHFTATLKGSQEVPANTSAGKGSVDATLDTATKTFTYTATYSGLTGPATAAHFHGPAAPGTNAKPSLPVTAGPSPITGKATLTDAQIADLNAGLWYFNVHTAANPGGEIRGQVMPQK